MNYTYDDLRREVMIETLRLSVGDEATQIDALSNLSHIIVVLQQYHQQPPNTDKDTQ